MKDGELSVSVGVLEALDIAEPKTDKWLSSTSHFSSCLSVVYVSFCI